MSDNKLVSGSLMFALASVVTYSYHMLQSNNRLNKKKYKQELNSIIEDNIVNNTPVSEINDDENLEQEEQIQELDKIVYKLENTSSNTLSSFLELNNTFSLTGTDELEFTKVEPNIDIPRIHVFNNNKYFSEGEIDSESESDIEYSYYSEGELFKNRKSKKRKLFQLFKKNKRS